MTGNSLLVTSTEIKIKQKSMVDTTQDLFHLVLTLCILFFTGFLCWMLYYSVRILKNTNEMFEMVKEKIAKVGNVIDSFKSNLVSQGLKGLFKFIMSQKERRSKTKNKK